jgi:ribonuclease G
VKKDAAKQLLISVGSLETRVALLEHGRPAEFHIERPGEASLVGNIYKGRVENVLAGMDAAFVDIGLDRNGFLYVDEVVRPELGSKKPKKITELLQGGSEVLVQVVRDPMGNKGPRLTTQLGLAGRYVVYLPGTHASGVSRRLPTEERERLRRVVKQLDEVPGGIIVRTAAEGAGQEAMARDLRFLQKIWGRVEHQERACKAPSLVYMEADLTVRSVRDVSGTEFDSVVVDDAATYRRLVNYLRTVSPTLTGRLQLYEGSVPLFEKHGLESQIRKALSRRVDLPSGGYIVIDHAEAMTVIDVNTGRYVGRRLLEETTVKTNVEACREIVRQLRLRDIGGIIVIDFIDMTMPTNREAVIKALEDELQQDRTKTYVVELSPLGLVEMTRQNTSRGLREVVTTPCPQCHGDGRVMSEDSALIEVERRLRALALMSPTTGVRVEVHPRIAERLRVGRKSLLRRLEDETGHRFIVQTVDPSLPLEHLGVVPD